MHDCLGPYWRYIDILSSSGRVSQSPSRHWLHVMGCGAFVDHFSAWHWLMKNFPLHFCVHGMKSRVLGCLLRASNIFILLLVEVSLPVNGVVPVVEDFSSLGFRIRAKACRLVICAPRRLSSGS